MMIDISTETILTLAEAAKRLPRRRRGRKTHVSTVYRWTMRGCRRVILEYIQSGELAVHLSKPFRGSSSASRGPEILRPPIGLRRNGNAKARPLAKNSNGSVVERRSR
jgi:hypothetical protein